MMSPVEDEVEKEAGGTTQHSMHLLWGHHTILATVFIISLVLGVPLSINKWWHLRVSSDRSGRGVIKLIQINYFMSLLSVPVTLFDLFILLAPSQDIPRFACVSLEWSASFLIMQRFHGGLPIALGRYIKSGG